MSRPWAAPLLLCALGATWAWGIGQWYFLADDFGLVQAWGRHEVRFWSEELFGYYRPLAAVTFRLDYGLWGADPAGYYATALLLHLACALLVWRLALRVPSSPRAALWAALLFLFLPGHGFAVLWLSARADLLCTLFCLLALLSKEMAASLPLLVLGWAAATAPGPWRSRAARAALSAAPYAAVLAAYLAVRHTLFGHLPASTVHSRPDLPNLLSSFVAYAATVLSPWGLEALRPWLHAHLFLAAPPVLAALVGAAVLLWRRRASRPPGWLVPLLWIPLTLLPVLRLFSPWNTYLPSVGAALLVPRLAQTALCVCLAAGMAYSLHLEFEWREGSRLVRSFLAEVRRTAPPGAAPLLVANAPSELRGVPVFGWTGGLESALAVTGGAGDVHTLASVRQASWASSAEAAWVRPGVLRLSLSDPQDFFRVHTAEVVSGRVPAAVGYSYSVGAALLHVARLDEQGRPVEFDVELGDAAAGARVCVWSNGRLLPVAGG